MGKDFNIEIEEAEERLRLAMLASDVKALDEMLAPDLVFTSHLGQCLGKEADLSAHKSGSLSISKLEPSEQTIKRVGGDVVVVSVRVKVVGQYAGQPADGDFRFTRVWVMSPNSRWQVVAAHAGVIA